MQAQARHVSAATFGFVVACSMSLGVHSAHADVIGLTLNPNSVYGTDSSTGTVTLDPPDTPFQSRTATLTSSNPSVASVPASMGFPAGLTQRTFTVTTYAINVSTNVTITATQGGVSRQAVITVRPPILTGVTFSPNPLVGGYNSTATITINRPAPSAWLCSISGPYPPVYFMTGSIVGFSPGATSTTKTINTQAVAQPVDALMTIRPPTGQSPNVTGTLQVVPIRAESLTLDPSAVTGGGAALGCVTLNAPAPAGGASVQLSSDDPGVASVPPTLQIPAGDDDGCFLIESETIVSCASAMVSATYGGQTAQATLSVGAAEQLTDNAGEDRWSARHSSTSGGRILWTDGDDIYFDNGTSTQLVQARGALDGVEDSVFGLGSGAAAGQVIGAWRRGTDFAWVWRSGGQPVLVNAVNPIDPGQALNPEAIAIADGSVFIVLQAFSDAVAVKHVFRVDPVSGNATNLTGNAAVSGAARVRTAGGKAAWLFDDDSGNPKLHFYNGSTVSIVDSGPISSVSLRLARGRLVYEKTIDGISHVFLFDSTQAGSAPVRLSPDIDPGEGHFAPATDGYHVAWLYGNADRTDVNVILNGGLQLNNDSNQPGNPGFGEFPLQLHRGQLLWTGAQDTVHYAAAGGVEALCPAPGSDFTAPWLADGYIAWFGPVQGSAQTDKETFMYAGLDPDDADRPLPPILVVPAPESGGIRLQWDIVLGASSYNVYLAEEPGVTKDNYAVLTGGRRVAGIASDSTTVGGLTNGQTYYFVVTALEGADEGGSSAEVSATPNPAWTPIENLSGLAFYAVASHDADGEIAYAAGNNNVYKTSDGGFTWTALGGAIAGRNTRALAVRGNIVFAVTIDGDVLRSTDAGAHWSIAANGDGYGEQNASIAIDPIDPEVVYAGDLQLSPSATTLVIKSIDGGDTWSHLDETDAGELHAYALSIDPDGVVYLAGSGVPVARSDDGGATWTDLAPGAFLFYSVAVDPLDSETIYAGSRDDGLFKSMDSGQTWMAINNGLPLQQFEPVNAIVVDPLEPGKVAIGTAKGAFFSTDGGATWIENNVAMGPAWVYALSQTSAGRLIAATGDGLYLLDADSGVPAATITAAVSRKSNSAGPGGTCDLPLFPGMQSEPRQGGVTEVRIAFDTAPGSPGDNPVTIEQSTCASPTYAPYAGASVAAASVAGNELILTFAPGLENARTYRINLQPGVTSIAGQFVEVRGLIGDVGSSGRTNGTDRSAIVSAWTSPANFSCVTDLDSSGRTNASDRSIAVAAWTGGQNCAP